MIHPTVCLEKESCFLKTWAGVARPADVQRPLSPTLGGIKNGVVRDTLRLSVRLRRIIPTEAGIQGVE